MHGRKRRPALKAPKLETESAAYDFRSRNNLKRTTKKAKVPSYGKARY